MIINQWDIEISGSASQPYSHGNSPSNTLRTSCVVHTCGILNTGTFVSITAKCETHSSSFYSTRFHVPSVFPQKAVKGPHKFKVRVYLQVASLALATINFLPPCPTNSGNPLRLGIFHCLPPNF